MAKNQIIGGAFQDLEGNVLANGYLVMELCGDEQIQTNAGQICAGIRVRVPLDVNGNIQGTTTGTPVYIWPNDQLNPLGSCYTVYAYTSKGQLAWGPQYQSVNSSPSPFNVSAWVPDNTGCGCGGSGGGSCPDGIELMTNGVDNIQQCKLNLVNGNNVNITSDASGNVTIAGTVAPTMYQHNESNVASEPNLDFVDSGAVQFTVTHDSGNQRVKVSANAASGALLPPPFPVPAGQAIAWAFPTIAEGGPADPGASNGGFLAGTTSGWIRLTQACGLCNWTWAVRWHGFTLPQLPLDAVIQGIYGVAIVNEISPGDGNRHASLAADLTLLNPWAVSPGGVDLNYGFPFSGEYYSASIGTSSDLSNASMFVRYFETCCGDHFDAQTQVNQVALAIYYTTANPPNLVGYTTTLPVSVPLSNSQATFASLTDGSPITFDANRALLASKTVTLNHTTATRALNVANMVAGGRYILKVVQDSTGGAALTLGTGPAAWKVSGGGGGAVSLTSAANAVDILDIKYDGTNCYVTVYNNYT